MLKYLNHSIQFALVLVFGMQFQTWSKNVDLRFGLVGSGGAAFASKFGLSYYTLEGNYASDGGNLFSSVDPANDPAPNFKVVREVAKLNIRNDGLGESNAQFQTKLNQYVKDLATWYALPAWGRGKKPVFKWYVPNALALVQAESLQIVETIRREKLRNPKITGTVWEIGNEPNLFPALLPVEYAAIFSNYYRVIKGEDPTATIAMGSLFMPETSQDLKARFGEELEAKMKTELQAAGLYNSLVSLGVFGNLVLDVKNTVLSRTLALSTPEYLRQVLDATIARPDLITVHVYPYDDRAPFLDSAAMQNILDTTAASISTIMAQKGISDTWGEWGSIWITEFGNIEANLDVKQVADRLRLMLAWFQNNSAYGHWFHYKSTGIDEQFALFSSGPAPLTRLAADPGFTPENGNFACDILNEVGMTYWRASHDGENCLDSSATQSGSTPMVKKDSLTPPSLISFSPPTILNEEGRALSPVLPLQWNWDSSQALGFDMATAFSTVELFPDSAGSLPLLKSDSIKASSLTLALSDGKRSFWPRVKIRDGQNHETPWSPWKKLNWEGMATTRILAGPAIGFSMKMTAQGHSFLILRIKLALPASVRVQILDARGQPRRTLFQGHLEAGGHAFPYDGRGERGRPLPSGIYFCRVQANGEARTIPTTTLP